LAFGAAGWFWALAALGGAVGGCAADDAAGEDAAEEEAPEPIPPPTIDLLVPELQVSAAALGEISLPVADLRPDTRVDIDGHTWLPGGGAPAAIVGEELRVPLGGAMVVGAHELRLRHRVGPELLESQTVAITIVPSVPTGLTASLAPEVVDLGDHLLAHGQGPDAVFGVLDAVGERVRVRAGQWSAAPFELELPGVSLGEGLHVGADLAIATTGPQRWVVVAWLAASGTVVNARIAPVDGHGVPNAEPGMPLELWRLDDAAQAASLGPHELARIDGVALLDRMVVIAIDARRDVEQASIGDHLLVTRLLTADGVPGAPVLVRGADSRDLDLPADARLWTVGPSTASSVRVGLGFPCLLELGSNGLPLLGGETDESSAVPSTSTWMASAEGAFGSRHTFALAETEASARVHLLRLNRWSAPDPEQITSEAIELPAWPTGRPSLAIFDGVPTLVLPMGPERDVLALRSTGVAAQLESIVDLRCDELALANPGTDGIADTLPLACLLAGELRLGVIGAS
jgi:hypothetical protein